MLGNLKFSKKLDANYKLFNIYRSLIGIQLSARTAIYIKRGFNAPFTEVPDLECVKVCHIFWTFPILQNYLLL